MLKVAEAQLQIISHVRVLNSMRLPLIDSLLMILSEEVRSDIDMPPFDNSAIDGFAVRSFDTLDASISSPTKLRITGESHAGSPCETDVVEGTAIRIMTGAPIPNNADACIMVEDIQMFDEGHILVSKSALPGHHLRRSGEDVRKGDVVLNPGQAIGSAEMAMLAATGTKAPSVYRKPRVAVVSTGDEVVDIDMTGIPPYGSIRNSNIYALAALVQESCAELHSMNHIPDDLNQTEQLFERLSAAGEADVIVSAGGVSMGDRDFIKPALEKLGKLEFWKVAMKPGKPLAFGKIESTLIFCLPGNPVSAMVTFELFVRPALRRLSGRNLDDLFRMTLYGTASCEIAHIPGREEYIRAFTTTTSDSGLSSQPTGQQGSGILSSMIGANSYIVLDEKSEGVHKGERIKIMMLN